jgi:hypothetical protein
MCAGMTPAFRTTIAELAATFATAITAAVMRASLDEIRTLGTDERPVRRGPGRPRGASVTTKVLASKGRKRATVYTAV